MTITTDKLPAQDIVPFTSNTCRPTAPSYHPQMHFSSSSSRYHRHSHGFKQQQQAPASVWLPSNENLTTTLASLTGDFALSSLETQPTRTLVVGCPKGNAKTLLLENLLDHWASVARQRNFPLRVVLLCPVPAERARLARYVAQANDVVDSMDSEFLTSLLAEQQHPPAGQSSASPVVVVFVECFAGENRNYRMGVAFDNFIHQSVYHNISVVAVSSYEKLVPRRLKENADYLITPWSSLLGADQRSNPVDIYRSFFARHPQFPTFQSFEQFVSRQIDRSADGWESLHHLVLDTGSSSGHQGQLYRFVAKTVNPTLPPFLSAGASYHSPPHSPPPTAKRHSVTNLSFGSNNNQSFGVKSSTGLPPGLPMTQHHQHPPTVLGTATVKAPHPETLPPPSFASRIRTPSPPSSPVKKDRGTAASACEGSPTGLCSNSSSSSFSSPSSPPRIIEVQ